jgi:Domain of unknown function (DUF4407)
MGEGSDGFGVLGHEGAQASSSSRARFPGTPLAWLGGAREPILRLCPGERSMYAGLGTGVLLTALFGGASAAFALSYVLNVPVSRLWPVAAFWTLTLANIDRLLLLITASKSRLLAMLPRLAISALLGFLIAEPLTLRIFQPEINAQMAITNQQAQAAQLAKIEHTYQPKITAANSQIARLHSELLRDQQATDHFRLKESWKQSSPAARPSFRRNHGPWYQHFVRNAAAARASYDAVAPGIRNQSTTLQASVSTLNSQQADAEQSVHAAIAGGSGWAARETALDKLATQHPGVNLTVWLVRLAFVLVDLAPLIVKFLMILFGKLVYDEIAAAVRERDRVEAHRQREQARLERNMATRRADAEDDIDEAVVGAHREQRVAAAYAGTQSAGGTPPRNQQANARDARIPALNLSQFASASRIHERMAVPIAQPLSRVAWIGTGLLTALALTLLLTQAGAHASITGGWLAPAALLSALALAAYSRGFRHGPAWAQRAAFGAGLLGLAVPAMIIAMNV